MKKTLLKIAFFPVGLLAITAGLFLPMNLMELYMLLSGMVKPGDRMFMDTMAPSVEGSVLASIISIALICLAIYLWKLINKPEAQIHPSE